MIFPFVNGEFILINYLAAGFLGLCLGSFATALMYRIPKDIPWIWDGKGRASRSACPSCDKTLTALDLIPVLSWVFSKGKCRHCGVPVSISYPLIELTCLALVLALYALWGNQLATIAVLLLVPFLVAHIVIDWKYMILPDDINIAVFVLAVLFLALGGAGEQWPYHIAAGILLPLLFWIVSIVLKRLKGKEALGQGDLKFLPSVGLLLGLAAIPSYLILSGLLGLATGLYYAFTGRKGLFPFGPALVFSALFHLFLTGYGFE